MFSDVPFTIMSPKPDGTVSSDVRSFSFLTQRRCCVWEQEYTTILACNVVWAEVLGGTLTVSFVEEKEKAQTACIRLSYGGSGGGIGRTGGGSLSIAYEGAILRSMNHFACTRHKRNSRLKSFSIRSPAK